VHCDGVTDDLRLFHCRAGGIGDGMVDTFTPIQAKHIGLIRK